MPIYEYECKDCKETVEKLQRLVDEPLKECPKCKHDTLVRVISTTSFTIEEADSGRIRTK